MSTKVILRPQVPGDLHAIVAYLDRVTSSPTTGDRFMAAVFPAIEGLSDMPGKGSPKYFRSKQLAGVRSWAVPGFPDYLILYRRLQGAMEVLAVTHGSRRVRALLLSRT